MGVRDAVYVWRYVLKSRARLNAVSGRREFEGALLRIGGGFGCLHPWPELGDPPLEQLLGEVREGKVVSGMARQAVAMASMDERWRGKGQSMFEQVAQWIPESHATLPECTVNAVKEAVDRGFAVIKVKGGRDFPVLTQLMDRISSEWPHLRWRIDFNEVLTKEESIDFAKRMPQRLWRCIDFLEDPCPWQRRDWEEIRQVTGLALALDRKAEEGNGSADVLVLKPARHEPPPAPDGEQCLVITSNMDHPLGQCFAGWWAGHLVSRGSRVETCGLQTHELFEPTEFSDRLGRAESRFRGPGGTGLGFDDLLEKLPWKRLS